MARITDPGAAFSATCMATAKVEPPEMPVKMPSFCASARAHFTPSGPAIAPRSLKYFLSSASCSTSGMKSGVQPWMRCGSKAGWLPAGGPSAPRSCALPLPPAWGLGGPPACKVGQDLARRRRLVDLGIGRRLELVRQEPAVGLGELDRLLVHAEALGRARREHDLGAQHAHQLAALDREAVGHGDHQRIALLGAHHGEPDAGVAAGRL